MNWTTLWLLCLPAALARGAEHLPGWGTNLDVAQRLARIAEKPVVVYFTAAWCGPCKLMAQTTLNEPSVEADLQHFSRVLIDIDVQPAVSAAQGVTAVPTFVLLDADGDALLRTSGYLDANRFRSWLGDARKEFAAATGRRHRFNEEKKAILATLTGADTVQLRDAVSRLCDLAASRERSALEFAVSQMKQVASRQPELLADGLRHTNLATRIHVANALQDAFGAALDFDPWETAEIRTRQVEAVRAKLRTTRP